MNAALQRHPRPAQWLRFDADGMLQLKSGKVELGQGIETALAMIVADGLDWPLGRVGVLAADTDSHPDEGMTSGSLSVQDSGGALREVCAHLRARLCAAAALRLGVEAATLSLADGGVVSADGRRVAIAALADAALMALPIDDTLGAASTSVAEHRIVGRSQPRAALAGLFAGRPHFIHDLVLETMLHGRVLHPPQPGDRPPAAVEPALAAARAAPGVVSVSHDGALFGVIAQTSAQADAALAQLAAALAWLPAAAPDHDPADPLALLQQPAETRVVAEHGTPGQGQIRLRARYLKPWLAHASIGSSCALARWDDDSLQVWTHSQGIHPLLRDLALAFGVDASRVTVRHAPGAGCYGHNGADDVAFDAAWLAREVPGRALRVLWSRADELARAPHGPAMVVDLEAGIDAEGAIVDWRHELWSPGHSGRPGRAAVPALLGHSQRAGGTPLPPAIDMPLAVGGGAERNAVPGYALPAWRVVAHRVTTPWRSSALRSLGAFANVFAAESFVDEIAHATAQDPLALRRSLLSNDARGLAVLDAAVARAGWAGRKAHQRAEGVGHGIGYARYKGNGAWCAVVAEVQAGATLTVRRLTLAVDVGLAVNPDGVVQQIEGGAIQATSWTLKEALQSEQGRITGASWDSYPILRFSEVPEIDVVLLPSLQPSLGAGEAALGPTAAAIANALFDALGVRVRRLPLTPAHIVAAMEEPTDQETPPDDH